MVLTHDMIVEGVHFLAGDPPGDVAWKLLAVNLSDLAAKGATPLGVLMGYGLGADAAWDDAFVAGLGEALAAFAVPLLGGDTVRMPPGAPRTLGLTAIGRAPATGAPARSGARAGDLLAVTGPIGDAGIGLAIAAGGRAGPMRLAAAYRRPRPHLAEGQALAPCVHAMADVSDGLLIDAARMADASGLAIEIDLSAVPLSADATACAGQDRAARLAAATAGDDYVLLAAIRPEALDGARRAVPALTVVGRFAMGSGLALRDAGDSVPLPPALGYEHG